MFNITEDISSWPSSVRGYSTNTPVLGGDNSTPGDSNLSLIDLANRTGYLYDRLGRFEDVVVVAANATITAASKYKLNYINASGGSLIITIDDVASFKTGSILAFKCNCPDKKMISFQTTSGQLIDDGITTTTIIYAAKGEEFKLVAAGDHWIMIEPKGNWDKVGQDDLCRFQPVNSIIANGCQPELGGTLLLRSDLPRLAAKVLPTAIDDATWLSDIQYRCFWSRGNETTTMRPPDMRAMFFRGLDLGRGIRIGQLDNTPGSYEVDDNKQHGHSIATTNSAASFNAGADPIRGNIAGTVNTRGAAGSSNTIGQQGSSEAKPKNAGFPPIIYY